MIQTFTYEATDGAPETQFVFCAGTNAEAVVISGFSMRFQQPAEQTAQPKGPYSFVEPAGSASAAISEELKSVRVRTAEEVLSLFTVRPSQARKVKKWLKESKVLEALEKLHGVMKQEPWASREIILAEKPKALDGKPFLGVYVWPRRDGEGIHGYLRFLREEEPFLAALMDERIYVLC